MANFSSCLGFLVAEKTTQKSAFFHTFSNIFERFRMFLNIFKRFRTFLSAFFLPILPNPYKPASRPPFLPQKSTLPRKNNLKKPYFALNHDNFTPNFVNPRLKKLRSSVAKFPPSLPPLPPAPSNKRRLLFLTRQIDGPIKIAGWCFTPLEAADSLLTGRKVKFLTGFRSSSFSLLFSVFSVVSSRPALSSVSSTARRSFPFL